MPDAQWIENMKQIMKQSMESEGPCDILIGRVAADHPLQIVIDQQLPPLSGGQLLTPERLNDHTVRMDLPEGTEEVMVHTGIRTGDQVLLIQQRGGQRFVVLDRL